MLKQRKRQQVNLKLDIRSLAYTFGILVGAYLFFAALLSSTGIGILFLNQSVVALFEDIFIGYSATPGGAIVGLIYGMIWGALWGGLIAWLYNKLT